MTYRVRLKGENWRVDAGVRDGQQHGYDEFGNLVVVVEFAPRYRYLVGSPAEADDVAVWHVSPEFAQRQKALVEWELNGHQCHGEA